MSNIDTELTSGPEWQPNSIEQLVSGALATLFSMAGMAYLNTFPTADQISARAKELRAHLGRLTKPPFIVPPFDGKVKTPIRRFSWWSWHPNYPYWSRSCWGGSTIEEAFSELKSSMACGMDVYHNKLIREDDGGVLVEVADRPASRCLDVWQQSTAQKGNK
jgi:hypothetical protein